MCYHHMNDSWSNCMFCRRFHTNCILTLQGLLFQYRKSAIMDIMVLNQLKPTVMPSVPWSIDYSEGTSSALAHSSIALIHSHYKHLVPLNFQLYMVNRKFSYHSYQFKKIPHRVKHGWWKRVRYRIIFADSLRLLTWPLTSKLLVIKLEQMFSNTVTPGMTHLLVAQDNTEEVML